jgi:hypothetical protein
MIMSLGALLTSPLAQIAASLGSGWLQQGLNEEFNEENMQRLGDIQNLYGGAQRDFQNAASANRGGYFRGTQNALGGYNQGLDAMQRAQQQYGERNQNFANWRSNALQDQLSGRTGQIMGGLGQGNQQAMDFFQQQLGNIGANRQQFQDQVASLRRRGVQELNQVGGQAREDVGQRFDQSGAQIGQNLRGRGLTSSSVAGGLQLQNEESRSDTLNRLNTDLARERVAFDQGVTGQSLAGNQFYSQMQDAAQRGLGLAQERGTERLAGYGSQLTGDEANAYDASTRFRLGTQQGAQGANQALRQMGMGTNLATQLGMQGNIYGGNRSDYMANTQFPLGEAGVLERVNTVMPGQNILAGIPGIMGQAYAAQQMQPESPNPWESAFAGGAATGIGTGFGTLIGRIPLPSDRNSKAKFEDVDHDEVLEKIKNLDVTSWHYKQRPGVRHMGPMAQDFKEAFDLGSTNISIDTVDAVGVLYSAVKALAARVEELESGQQAPPPKKRGPGRPKKEPAETAG